MTQTLSPAIRRHVAEWTVLVVAVLLCVALLSVHWQYGQQGLVVVLLPVLIGIWIFFAREAWWVMVPAVVSAGGVFYFGFRIYPHEIGMVVSLLPLVPVVAVRRNVLIRRTRLPRWAYALLFYLGAHFAFSAYLCRLEGLPGFGTMFRVYVRGLWPLIFAVPFFAYGSSRYLKRALAAIYATALIRSTLGALGYFFPAIFMVPVINYVVPGVYTGGIELRESALWLLFASMAYLSMVRRPFWVAVNLAMVVVCGWFVLLGGGRVSLGMFFVAPLLWAVLERRWVLLLGGALLLASVVMTLNVRPDMVYRFPARVRRTLSIVILKSPYQDVHRLVEGSDEWHQRLAVLGARKWLSSPVSFLLGNRVYPFDEEFKSLTASMDVKLRVAADLGYYESGLWTVLAVIGLVGAWLYVMLFIVLLREPAAALWRRGIRDHTDAFAFLAVVSLAVWLLFSWIAGHFPSEQLLLALIARAAYDDRQAASI